MGLRNMTIGARLFIGFAIIFALVVLLGGMAYQLSNRLWKNTEDMHNFSLQASKATRDIKADIITMQWLMKDIVLDDKLSRDEILTIKNKIDTYEKKVYGSFDVVKESYLGNKSDIDTTYNLFSNWKPLRDIVIDLKQRGDRKEEYLRFRNVNIPYVSGLLDHIQFMVDAAGVRADNFYQQAQKNKDLLFTRLWIVTGFIFLLAFLIGYLLFRGIRNPLIALTVVADQYRQKNYSVRSDYISDNEIGNLASTFNGMAARVEQEISVKENASWIIDLILKENDLSSFSKVLLNILVTKTGSQVAAIYFLNEEETQYEHYDSIGLDKEKRISFSAITKEGEFGAALTEKRIVRIKQISADTIFSLPCVTGIVHPREIITIPILDGNKVISIISLAAINDYSPEVIQLINEIWLPLTANIIGVLAFRTVIGISEKLDIQNKELEEKSAELLQQTSELKEYNIELELQKRQLDEANHLKSSFLSNMSHELRTPLNSVIALSGVLNRQLKGIIPENEYKYLSIIEKNGKQLLLLINDILDLSRIEAGKEEISYSRFSIYDLVQDLMGSLQPIGIEKGISIINHINPKLPLIVSDHSKCLHILQNIIGNAIKFTNEGTVEISADVDNKFIHISVKDTGIGISVENTPYIFDEFRQADDKASRIYGGTGLGLAIASKYCNMLQGKVEVESQLHKGSVFTVTLPIMPDHLQIDENERNIKPFTDKAINPPAVSLKPVKGKNILLVEDNEAAIIQMKDILMNDEYNIRIANNGKEALEIIPSFVPDAIILDLMMPEVDGFDVLVSIRKMKETSKIPVLILSAKHVTNEELGMLRGNHIYQLIQKGDINKNELLGHIRNMVTMKNTEKTDLLSLNPDLASGLGKKSILVIEDNLDNMETVKALLVNEHEIIEALDGLDGLGKAKKLLPDLILMDISLPGMDGVEVLKEIKKDKKIQNIPVIALTARVMNGDREELLAHGFDDYISKPIDNAVLERTINEWLHGN